VNAGIHVLYAEDDENDAFFMQRAFAKLRRSDALRIAHNGRKAVAYLNGEGEYADRSKFPLPDILLLDVKMPELSGLEVLAWVRAQPQFSKQVIVMFTSSTQDSDVERSRAGGANAYLVKPSNADNLAPLVESIIRACEATSASTRPLSIAGNLL
jgi:CheY-like chemotaxis protein